MASNIEEFLIELKLVDKGTLQKVKKFYRDFDKMGEKVHKTEKKRQSEFEKFQDAVSKEKLRDVKREQAAKEKAHKEELRRIKEINTARRRIMRTTQFQNLKGSDRKEAAEFLKQFKRKSMSGDIEGMKDLQAELRRTSGSISNLRRQQLGLSTVQRGLTDSTRNMVRTYASLFALFEGTQAINRVGQSLEAMETSMMLTSDNPRKVAENLEYVRFHAHRLGLDLTETSKAFVRINAAASGKLSEQGIENIFLGITEASTSIGLSAPDTTGALRAIQQMIQKGQIFAEEFSQQLNERMPLAMKAMEKATGKTSGELRKMMENGELGIDVLDEFGRTLREMAGEGTPAFEAAMKRVGKQQDRFLEFTLPMSANKIFKSGFGEGLSELFKSLTESIGESEEGLKGLGKIFESVFNTVRLLSETLIPVLDTVFTAIGGIMESVDALFGSGASTLIFGVGLFVSKLGGLLSVLGEIKKAYVAIFGARTAAMLGPKGLVAVLAGLAVEDVVRTIQGSDKTVTSAAARGFSEQAKAGNIGAFMPAGAGIGMVPPVNMNVTVDGFKTQIDATVDEKTRTINASANINGGD